ncbi:MAG: hypothetical protein ACJ76Q_15810 [Solirubrobacteraceae bacterium]
MPLRLLVSLLAVLALAGGSARAATRGDWDPGAQQIVVRSGLMQGVPGAGFAGERASSSARPRSTRPGAASTTRGPRCPATS